MGVNLNPIQRAWYGSRDAIEGLIRPVNSPVSAVLHLGVGMGLVAGVGQGVGALMPEDDPTDPRAFSREEWDRFIRIGALAGSVLPVVLTAGAQIATPTGMNLARGIHPIYFLGVGGIGGQLFINEAVKS